MGELKSQRRAVNGPFGVILRARVFSEKHGPKPEPSWKIVRLVIECSSAQKAQCCRNTDWRAVVPQRAC